ncbi:MAG TPA: outer membrane beta-barrel protein [Pirellulales bacterium]|jgi:hypothetical protein|nr:outer membrane beta-barrel protein [Pirellulales bacterium]
MQSAPENRSFKYRLRRLAACAVVAVVIAATLRAIEGADASLPDNRATNSGKPLVFRPADSVALDRDDLEAAKQTIDWPALIANRPNYSADQTGLLTQMHFAAADGGTNPLRQPRLAAAEPSAATDAVPPSPMPDVAAPTESGPIVAPPAKTHPPVAPADSPSSGVVEPLPEGYPTDGGPPLMSPHGDLPGGIWPHDYLRHQLAEPLVGASWCNEPYHVDWFLGVIRGTEIIRDRVDQNVGVVGGFRLGWDYDLYWGLETRLGFSSLEDQPENAPLAGSADKVVLWDSSLLYYPWGDSRWRPYIGLGLGLSEFRFTDDLGDQIRRNLLELPFGVGLKYRLHDWLTLRADVTDNLALGSSGLATMNNVSFTTGLEFRFGGCHQNYWPWEPASAR